jgi:2-oxoglutarate ferredoxin oxidoreductase subunit gamma
MKEKGRRYKEKVDETVICAGFGGQGIMVLGKVLAEVGMAAGFNVTWLPSYGAEVRGGTAHAMVRISSRDIPSPVVAEANAAIIMNGPSLKKFIGKIKKGGLLILNTSMSEGDVKSPDIDVIEAPLTDEAMKLGNIRVANMIAAGIYVAKKDMFEMGLMTRVIEKMAGSRKELIPVNIKAVERGMEIGGRP